MARRAGRRYHRSLRPTSPLGITVFLLVAIIAAWRVWQEQHAAKSAAPPAEGICRVEKVVDGDTLVLEGGTGVRLIGADTPETVDPRRPVQPWGREATQFTKHFLAAKEVRLEFDGDRHDKYGRLLAYVWVDDRMLNEELIRAGLAKARTSFNYSRAMKTRFRRAEDEARAAGRAIWSEAKKQ